MPKSRLRSYFLVPSFIVLCSIVAAVMGGRGVSAASPADDADQSLKAFTKVYSTVEQNFADEVKPERASTRARFRACCGRSIRTPISSIRAITRPCGKTSAAGTTA